MFALFVWLSGSLIPVYGWHFNAAPAQSQYGFEIPHLPCSGKALCIPLEASTAQHTCEPFVEKRLRDSGNSQTEPLRTEVRPPRSQQGTASTHPKHNRAAGRRHVARVPAATPGLADACNAVIPVAGATVQAGRLHWFPAGERAASRRQAGGQCSGSATAWRYL